MTTGLLIPCFNSENHLKFLFDSISNLETKFDEILFYDDASTDGTSKAIEDKGFKVIKGRVNKGAAYARNRLIEQATADYIHFHDADDSFSTDLVARFVKNASDNNDNSKTCFISNMKVVNELTEQVGLVEYDDLEKVIDFTDYFLNKNGFAIIGFYPRKFALEVLFDEALRGNEDPDFHIRLAVNGGYFIPLKKALVTNHINSTSFSQTNWNRCMEDKLKCLYKYNTSLDIKYHRAIALQAVKLSNYFYREGNERLSCKAKKLTSQLKLSYIDFSIYSKLVSLVFGVNFYMWLCRRRIDLKWN